MKWDLSKFNARPLPVKVKMSGKAAKKTRNEYAQGAKFQIGAVARHLL